jgi:general secretion pathway protein E
MTALSSQSPSMAARNGGGPSPARELRYDARSLARHLVASGVAGENDLRVAAEVARRSGTSDLRALLDLGSVGEEALAGAIAVWSGCARWRAAEETGAVLDPAEGLPEDFMKAHGVLALEASETADAAAPGGSAVAAPIRLVVADPSDHLSWSAVQSRFSGRPTTVLVGTQKEIGQFLAERSSRGDTAEGPAVEASLDVSSEIGALRELASEAPVIRFFNQAADRAMDLGASDIHIERYDRRVSLRLRVDGVLIEQPPPAAAMYEALLCRIKILANLDIAERRRAQDGRIRLRLRGRAVDMRVSIVPTTYGQDAAIRLQDRQRLADIKLEDLGFSKENIGKLFAAADRSHGIVLITGPTGSGKTTTLYALVRRLVNPETKVVTVEDPVEYQMDGVTQIQVNPAINLTFGNTLRNILRHDPDVILVGEIRDKETAEMAFQSALTGHMVLSTLHTNDVPSTFVRLVDMGVEPYLVNAAIEGVQAQRLVRRVCPVCRNVPAARVNCKASTGTGPGGSQGCGGIGYKGRLAVMEFSGVSGALKRAMLQGADEHRLRDTLLSEGYLPMRVDAQRLVDAGLTDEAEVVRALGAAGADATGESR